MKILLIASEVEPYAKTGGLADVAGALPQALAERGHDARVVMPLYEHIDPEAYGLRVILPELWVNFPKGRVRGRVLQALYPDPTGSRRPVPVYFIDCPEYFARPGLYGENGRDYPDNADRFAFFNMAAIWMLKMLGWAPDVIHCNDWQAAFLPVFLRGQVKFRFDRFFARTRILFTIHNLGYMGLCDFGLLERSGLSPALFQAEQMEYWGALNPLKGGIAFSDWVNTVSRQYAREILTSEYGCGIEGFIANRSDRLSGILNGIDMEAWNPETDSDIAARYSVDDLSGKAECKRALLKSLRWSENLKTPLVAMIGRLDAQKGFDLFLEALPQLAKMKARFVILGNGNPDLHTAIEAAAKRYPKALRARLMFDSDLARVIEAGADVFLMPSRYEPCGLNQMFSLRYGTVPIVHNTGGLADTVCNARAETVAAGTATGFTFHDYTPEALVGTLEGALSLFRNEPEVWRRIQRKGTLEDFSWDRSAGAYEHLYHTLLSRPSPFLPAGV